MSRIGERAFLADALEQGGVVFVGDRGERGARLVAVPRHRRHEVAVVRCRHIGQRMRPVFEDTDLVGRLRALQVGARVLRNAGVQDDGGCARSHG